MKNFKRILIFIVIFLLLGLYAVAMYFAFTKGENTAEIIIFCFASICILSIFIGVIMRVKKYSDEKNEKNQKN